LGKLYLKGDEIMISGSFSPGTTPTHTFTLPFEKEMLADLRISYLQNKKKILTKEMEDVEINGNDINLTLTQEETFLFESGKNVFI
jgi:hypothetical protein